MIRKLFKKEKKHRTHMATGALKVVRQRSMLDASQGIFRRSVPQPGAGRGQHNPSKQVILGGFGGSVGVGDLAQITVLVISEVHPSALCVGYGRDVASQIVFVDGGVAILEQPRAKRDKNRPLRPKGRFYKSVFITVAVFVCCISSIDGFDLCNPQRRVAIGACAQL